MARLELEVGTDVLLLETGDALLLQELIEYDRSGTALLGLKSTGARLVALTRAETALLGLKTIGVRVIVLSRADTVLLGLKTTASRIIAYSRIGTALLGLKTTASYCVWLKTLLRVPISRKEFWRRIRSCFP